jgi:hypothetical protein
MQSENVNQGLLEFYGRYQRSPPPQSGPFTLSQLIPAKFDEIEEPRVFLNILRQDLNIIQAANKRLKSGVAAVMGVVSAGLLSHHVPPSPPQDGRNHKRRRII